MVKAFSFFAFNGTAKRAPFACFIVYCYFIKSVWAVLPSNSPNFSVLHAYGNTRVFK